MPDRFIIAIASGKGGTGKTTIAVNLAYFLAGRGKNVQYMDCDVEEPNGHIFLKPHIKETIEITIGVPEINLEKCNGCGKCGQLCQYSAIICLKDKVLVFDRLCHCCGGCMLVCPIGAIAEKPKSIGFVDLGLAGQVKFAQGRLNIADIHTPTLIKHVKQNAINEGLVIIDAPAGTSCPVVEAIKGADFVLLVSEPTPFGLNDLKLAIEVVRQLKLPFAVLINRYGLGNKEVLQFCKTEHINIVTKLLDDRRIAQAYSSGKMIIDTLPEYKSCFVELSKAIKIL